MKKATLVANYLLALPYVVFGLNYFLNFIPTPPMEGDPGTFATILATSGFMTFVKILEIVLGLMLALNFRKHLALVLLAPISVNILLFELFIAHQPGIGILLVALNTFLLFSEKEKLNSLIKA